MSRIVTIKLLPPVPFIDIEKAISRSVNRMLSVRQGSKILKMFSTTKWEELLKVECSERHNLTFLGRGGHILWEDIFDQLSDLDPVDFPAGEVSLEGAPELHNLILSEPCVLEVDLKTKKNSARFQLLHLFQPVILPVGELVRLVLAGDDHL